LEELVADYQGTLLLVSHDRAFLDNVVTSTLVFEGAGAVNEYVGGYSDWLRQARPAPKAAMTTAAPAAPQSTIQRSALKPTPAGTSKLKRLSYHEQRELAALPDTIQRLEAEERELQGRVNDPQFFKREAAAAAEALQRLTTLAAELESAYARWDALESTAG
jgi:ATP-binding cassette subfamily F protein uup